MNNRFDPVSGKIFPVFFYYTVPSVIGVLAMSCAVIVDGFFIGNYGGADTLAAVNLAVPVVGLFFGIAMMLSVGGAARCGKYLGEGKRKDANGVFSQTLAITLAIALAATLLSLVFMDKLVFLLGANAILSKILTEYLTILLLFNTFQMGMVCLAYFLRVDSFPFLASLAMVLGSLLNVLFDWVFIAHLHMGHKGAALGTGLSELVTFMLLAAPFLLNRTRLKFDWQKKQISEAFRSAGNGFSEFSNEISASFLLLLFNWLMMQRFGENGVAAFSIINYIVLCGLLISSGISESLQPVVSKNLGAMNHKRITSFLLISSVSVFTLGILTSILLNVSPRILIEVFLRSSEKETINHAIYFISKIWPVFLLNGLNIILCSYLTAMHRAFSSSVIALARGLVLPVFFLVFIRFMTGYDGILIVLPLSEVTAFLIALLLVKRNSPAKLIRQRRIKLRRQQPANCPIA